MVVLANEHVDRVELVHCEEQAVAASTDQAVAVHGNDLSEHLLSRPRLDPMT
jgi:hypothetical protein